MFGENFKYILALGFLFTFVYTTPSVLDSVSSGIANSEQAAVWDGWFSPAGQNNIQAQFQIHRDFGSTSGNAEIQHPPMQFGSSSPMIRPPFASSTSPMGDREGKKNGPMNPQDVISVLFKAGIISADKVDQARQLFPQPSQVGSSTVSRIMPPPFMGDKGMMGSTTPPMHMNEQRPPQQGANQQPPRPGSNQQ